MVVPICCGQRKTKHFNAIAGRDSGVVKIKEVHKITRDACGARRGIWYLSLESVTTSPGGKAIGAFTMVSGILTLALPITVISSNYATEVAAQQARANLKELETQSKRRRQHVFANKSAAARNQALASYTGARRRRGDPSVLLTVLNQINTEVSWSALPLLEGEARAILAARQARPTEHQLEGEMAMDRYYMQGLALLRTQPCPLTDKHVATIRRELLAYYSSFTY